MCKINPRVDFAFKKLFGSEENKDLLISLINSIVDEKDMVTEVQLKNPYNLADYKSDKMSILDIKAKDKKGKWYNIEMQIAEDIHFDKRAIYYWSKLVTDQLSESVMFKTLTKTISINILDFNYVNTNLNYHNKYKISNTDTKTNDNLHDIFELHYIELNKFKKEYKEIADVLDRWIIFLSKSYELDKKNLPKVIAEDKLIVKAIEEVDRMFNEEERGIYNIRMQKKMNQDSEIESAKEVAWTKGMKKGMEKGGKNKSIEIAINLLDVLDEQTISKKTGLSIEEIKSLRNK